MPVRRSDVSGAAYNSEGCLVFARDTIFECNSSCQCGADCTNRVVGNGITAPLQVFKTVGRGWGVRSRNPIRAGTFVCEYTGVMLRDEDAEAAGLEVVLRAALRRVRSLANHSSISSSATVTASSSSSKRSSSQMQKPNKRLVVKVAFSGLRVC